ncbi:MAG: hypothetical protein ACE14M_13680 [Terriglobales bacterium]
MKSALCACLAAGLLVLAAGCSQIDNLFKEKEEKPLTAREKVRVGFGGTMAGTDEPGAVQSLRNIVSAQATYTSTNPDKGFACSLDELRTTGMLDPALASGSSGGYRFRVTCDGGRPAMNFRASAVPSIMGSTTFCVDESGTIKSALGPAERCFSGNNIVQ